MNTSSASGRLRAILSLVEAGPHGATAALWRADRPRERYLAYLVTMHQVIRASVPLMERAADLADRAAPCGADPLAALARYLRAHVLEEAGHDAWLLEDLAAAGVDTRAVTLAVPRPTSPRSPAPSTTGPSTTTRWPSSATSPSWRDTRPPLGSAPRWPGAPACPRRPSVRSRPTRNSTRATSTTCTPCSTPCR